MSDEVLSLKTWSVNGWAIRQYLLTLKLGLFPTITKWDEEATNNKYFFADCSFNKPSRINFHHFTPHNSSIIQEIIITSIDTENKLFRFTFSKNSFIEIEAQNYSIIKW